MASYGVLEFCGLFFSGGGQGKLSFYYICKIPHGNLKSSSTIREITYKGVAVMESNSHDHKVENGQIITSLADMSIAELTEEAELDQVDFETLMEEIRVS